MKKPLCFSIILFFALSFVLSCSKKDNVSKPNVSIVGYFTGGASGKSEDPSDRAGIALLNRSDGTSHIYIFSAGADIDTTKAAASLEGIWTLSSGNSFTASFSQSGVSLVLKASVTAPVTLVEGTLDENGAEYGTFSLTKQ